MSAEERLDPRDRAAGRCNRELLTRDLEQRGAEDVHRWEIVQPGPRIERRIAVDDPGQNRITFAKACTGALEPRRAVRISRCHGVLMLRPSRGAGRHRRPSASPWMS